MADEEKIKKSIERNRKKGGDEPRSPETQQASSFKTLCRLLNAPASAKFLAIAMVIAAAMVYKLSTGKFSDEPFVSVALGILTMIVIAGGYALYLYSWYPGYAKFVNDGSPLAEEWIFFVNTRSEQFLKDELFVKITVSMKMTGSANADHHKMIEEFLSRWQSEGSGIYTGSKWTGSRPDSFTVAGKSISGHVSVSNGMKLLLKKLLIDIPRLAAQVGKERFTPEILWTSERNFNQEDPRDSIDEAKEDERHRQMREKD